MEFVDGDSIGVFAIKDGAIMDNIDNAKLVYNMSSGSWNPVGNGTLYWYDGVSYVAYYPYRKNITIDLSKGMDGAIASLTGNRKTATCEGPVHNRKAYCQRFVGCHRRTCY